MIRVVETKWYCMRLKVACFAIAYFLLVVHIALTAIVTYMTLMIPKDLIANDPEAMRKIMDLMLLGQFVYPICISNIKFTIVLLCGLHLNLRILIRLYLIFAAFILLVTVAGSFILEFVLQKNLSPSVSILVTTVYAYFVYTIRRHWQQLNPNVQKLIKQMV